MKWVFRCKKNRFDAAQKDYILKIFSHAAAQSVMPRVQAPNYRLFRQHYSGTKLVSITSLLCSKKLCLHNVQFDNAGR